MKNVKVGSRVRVRIGRISKVGRVLAVVPGPDGSKRADVDTVTDWVLEDQIVEVLS